MTDTPSETKRQASFTTGPWRTITQGYGRWYIYPAPNGALIAAVDSAENARLIAAAPQMYAALDLLLQHYVALVNCGDCGIWNPEKDSQVIAARDALRKASERTEC